MRSSAPARPVYSALMAKAMVLYWARFTPMASAARSFSRMARKARPVRPRTRLRAKSSIPIVTTRRR